MDETLNLAFTTLATGMITVFFILLLVMLSGRILIKFTNRFYSNNLESDPRINKAIELAVNKLTDHQAQIIKIEPRNS